MDVTVKYFERGGKHTDEVLAHAKQIIDNRGIKDIIVATTRGETGVKACEAFDPSKYNVVVVTHSDGFRGTNNQELDEKNKEKIISLGGKVLTATHTFSGVETGISKMIGGGNVNHPVELFARLVRMVIADGVKVCMEIACMAADAGMIPDIEKDTLCIGGTGAGADTACIIKAAYSRAFPEMKVKQIICKPEISRNY